MLEATWQSRHFRCSFRSRAKPTGSRSGSGCPSAGWQKRLDSARTMCKRLLTGWPMLAWSGWTGGVAASLLPRDLRCGKG